MIQDYNILIKKLDKFIRKYYFNQIIRGSILSLILISLLVLIPSVIEYFGQYPISTRTAIFYSIVGVFLITFSYFIVYPVLKLLKIGRIISYKQAAQIISQHFSDLQDKLINTLELAQQSENNTSSQALLLASIEQRINNIKPIPFASAVNFRDNLKYAKYLAVIAIIFGLIMLFYPTAIVEGSQRIVNYNTFYAPKAPFEFYLKNDSLKVQKGGDLLVEVETRGAIIPDNVLINYGGNNFSMKKETKTRFSYRFRNINNPLDFYFSSSEFFSQRYKIEVLPDPLIVNFVVDVDVPDYTGEPDFQIQNIGDLNIPKGSKVNWKFSTIDIDSLEMQFSDERIVAKKDSLTFSVDKRFTKSANYSVDICNRFFKKANVIKYSITVFPDLYPEITISSVADSINPAVVYFKGMINDDYGFTSLTFNLITDSLSTDGKQKISLPLNKNLPTQDFYYSFDFSSIKLTPGQSVEYYFEVFDNDGINGPKSSKSRHNQFKIPTHKEIDELKQTANKSMQENLENSMQLVDELQKDLMKLQQSAINNNTSKWEKSQLMKNISQKQKQLQDLLENVSEQNKEKNALSNTYTEQEEQILEKQKQIEELLENLMTDEMKDMLKQIEELQQKMENPEMNELSEEMKFDYEDLDKELDRSLELLKKFEVEEKINDVIDELEDLAIEQENLSEQTENKDTDLEQLEEKQNEQAERFNDAMKKYEEALKKNEELENPMSLEEFKEKAGEIQKEFKEGNQNMQDGKRKKSSKSQKRNSQKLNELSSAMKNMMESNQAMMISQSIEELRQILENLVEFSFAQEELMDNIRNVYTRDPVYVEYINKQKKLGDDFKIINDSLTSLAKKTPQLEKTVTKEVSEIRKNLSKGLEHLEERHISTARSRQQFVMTSANNLALLLSEILEAMQQQKAGSMSGSQQCQKPGQGKPSFSQMKQQQQSLKKQLEQMLQQMKNQQGKQKGKGKGDKNKQKGKGKSGMGQGTSQQLSKMLSQQEIFGKMIRDLKQKGNLNGETMKKLDEINKLIDENKRDIINRKVNAQTLMRQNQIETRLLEAEDAEREREFEQKRESKEAKENKKDNVENKFPFTKLEKSFKEELEFSNLKMHNFYKNKYKTYILKLNQDEQ